MNKMNELFTRLQGQQPSPDHPDELTERIMQSLPKPVPCPDISDSENTTASMVEPDIKPPVLLRIVRVVSTVAASWFIGWFIYVNPTEKATATNETVQTDAPQAAQLQPSERAASLRLLQSNRQSGAEEGKLICYTELKQLQYEK